MMHYRTKVAAAALIGLSMIAACSQNTETAPEPAGTTATEVPVLANGMTPKEQIELRQAQLKKLGKAFKTISDQLKSGEPDIEAVKAAAASIPVESAGMEEWFPEGTGPDSGVKTDALAAIWEDRADFESKLADFRAASDQLAAVAEGGDITAIASAFQATGGTCKSCHEKFREDD